MGKSKIRVVFDKTGNTLDVWFGNPKKAVCEETSEEFILKKDVETGEIVGFEKFNVLPAKSKLPELTLLVK